MIDSKYENGRKDAEQKEKVLSVLVIDKLILLFRSFSKNQFLLKINLTIKATCKSKLNYVFIQDDIEEKFHFNP